MYSQFDPDRGSELRGRFNTFEVFEQPPTGPSGAAGDLSTAPNHVINTARDFKVDLQWELTGSLAPLHLTALDGSDWVVSIYAEALGPGTDLKLAEAVVPNPGAGGQVRNASINIDPAAAGMTDENPGGLVAGIYRLYATVFLNAAPVLGGADITGFAEGPIIKVEDPA